MSPATTFSDCYTKGFMDAQADRPMDWTTPDFRSYRCGYRRGMAPKPKSYSAPVKILRALVLGR